MHDVRPYCNITVESLRATLLRLGSRPSIVSPTGPAPHLLPINRVAVTFIFTKMASALNVYTSEPADLVLAHTLLKSKPKTEPSRFSTASDSEWNLQEDWDAGIRVSNTGIFRSGTVIGFSRLRTRSRDSDEYIGQVGLLSGIFVGFMLIASDPPSSSHNTLAQTSSVF